MDPVLFTVLLPVHRPPAMLPFAIESVLAQSERSFRLCVICDGAPPETADCARTYAARDPRVEVFDFEKGERHGEAHRHKVLETANSAYVAQIGDDDIWLPDYLREMAALLKVADFGNLPQVEVMSDGAMHVASYDLARLDIGYRMIYRGWNYFGPTFTGYRLAAYRELVDGWTPAPHTVASDTFMWRKFARAPGLRFGTRFSIQGVRIGAVSRKTMSLEERAVEVGMIAERMRDPIFRGEYQIQALEMLAAALNEDGSRRARLSLKNMRTAFRIRWLFWKLGLGR
jgi:glycosyltransferase involved in cell wall biosynthesis